MLADGSQLAMDARTSVTVDYRGDGRHLVLEQGRATFTVAKDPLHPFSVASHGSLVVATGTQFGVEWLGNQTRVVLYEGHVAILRKQGDRLTPGLLAGAARDMPADSMLTPGREAVVNDGQTGINVHDLASPWRKGLEQGQIDASDVPLGVVAARMNRYLPGPHLRVTPDAAPIRISGVFNAGDLDAFVAGVTRVFPVEAERQADGSFCLRGTSNSTTPAAEAFGARAYSQVVW
jgi:transmembrane sensor